MLRNRPGDRAAIEKLDTFLTGKTPNDRLRVELVARQTGLARGVVRRLLRGYESHALLRSSLTVECQNCEQLHDLEEVDERLGRHTCERCGHLVDVADEPEGVEVWRPTVTILG